MNADLRDYIRNNKLPHIIVANLPYVPERDVDPKMIRFEDKNAISGGIDGLDLIRTLLWEVDVNLNTLFKLDLDYSNLCTEVKLPDVTVFLETDSSHSPAIIENMIRELKLRSLVDVAFRKDLCGKNRFVICRFAKKSKSKL